MKKRAKKNKQININITISNRWLYTFVVLGILALFGISIGVFATVGSTSKGWHPASQIDFSEGISSAGNIVSSGTISASGKITGDTFYMSSSGTQISDQNGKYYIQDTVKVNELYIGVDRITGLNNNIIYKMRTGSCSDSKVITLESTCTSIVCNTPSQSVSAKYYDCSGNCDESSPQTCANYEIGRLVNTD